MPCHMIIRPMHVMPRDCVWSHYFTNQVNSAMEDWYGDDLSFSEATGDSSDSFRLLKMTNTWLRIQSCIWNPLCQLVAIDDKRRRFAYDMKMTVKTWRAKSPTQSWGRQCSLKLMTVFASLSIRVHKFQCLTVTFYFCSSLCNIT